VSTLPRKLADVVREHYFNGMSYQDIALRLGVPLSTVKARLHQARQILKPALSLPGTPAEEEVASMAGKERRGFTVPTVEVQPCPGESMEVRLPGPLEHPPLREGAFLEKVRFPLHDPDHVRESHCTSEFIYQVRVVAPAVVDREPCWRVEYRRTPRPEGVGPQPYTAFFGDRPDGFYELLSWWTELRKDGTSVLKVRSAGSLEVTLEPEPKVIRPGLTWTHYGGRQAWRCEGVVQVRINQHQERCLEVIQPTGHEPPGHIHRRYYINADGLTILKLDYEPEWPELWKNPPVTPREASFGQYQAYVAGVTVPTDLLDVS
jgi:hypothetical protein